jgi:hypothetical protein
MSVVRVTLTLLSLFVLLALPVGCGKASSSADDRGDRVTDPRGGTSSAAIGGSAGTGATLAGGASGAGVGGTSPTGGASGSGVGGSSGANGGASGSSGTAGEGGIVTEPDISGRWAMFYFEDPVAVDLSQSGSTLSGTGCCAGLGTPTTTYSCCGPIMNGSIESRRVRFAFTPGTMFTDLTGDYGVDATVSGDGSRIVGGFGTQGSTGPGQMVWARIPESQTWLVGTDDPLYAAAFERMGTYTLGLTDGSGGDYSPDRTYEMMVREGPNNLAFVRGDFGQFWSGEMTWDEPTETLSVGPVPATLPELPVALTLDFSGTTLVLEATMPSGATYTFEAL